MKWGTLAFVDIRSGMQERYLAITSTSKRFPLAFRLRFPPIVSSKVAGGATLLNIMIIINFSIHIFDEFDVRLIFFAGSRRIHDILRKTIACLALAAGNLRDGKLFGWAHFFVASEFDRAQFNRFDDSLRI